MKNNGGYLINQIQKISSRNTYQVDKIRNLNVGYITSMNKSKKNTLAIYVLILIPLK